VVYRKLAASLALFQKTRVKDSDAGDFSRRDSDAISSKALSYLRAKSADLKITLFQ